MQPSQTYGASNQRLIEQVGDENSSQRTYYAWQGESVIAEYSESASNPSSLAWSKSYIYLGARLLATLAAGAASERVEYQHPDRLGTRLVTNNQDTTSFEQAALAYGTALDGESAGATKRRFTSYERSSVSGLDYGVNRHYDPLQGRFTQVDPIGMRSTSLADPQTLNLYAYCANDPVNRIDPNGLGFFGFLGSLFKGIGKVLGVVATVAKWVTFAVAATVAVLVVAAVVFSAPWAAAALQWLAPLMGKLIFSAAEGGAGVSAGEVAGGLVAAGSVNNFITKKRTKRGGGKKRRAPYEYERWGSS
ncbi:MAG: RHS repeat-associated core domain-containing protein [Blastocatellia bacterium]